MAPFGRDKSPDESGLATPASLREQRQVEAASVDTDSFPELIIRPKFQGDETLMRTYLKEELYVSL